jgi:archaellum component FlaC
VVPLAVDPAALFAAGSAVGAAGDGLAASLTVLTAGFAAHTGLDAAGMVFGLAYQDAAEKLLQAAAAAINACRHCGALIQQGASNYSTAEAASTLGGGAGVLEAPPEPVKISAPWPPGTLGPGQPPPLLWALVQSFLDDVWPDGDAAALRAAATRWRSFGGAASGMQGALNASKSLLDGQQIPEGGQIDDALSKMGTAMATIGEQCGKLATSLDGFADEVEHAQNSIRDLLHRLESLTDLAHDVMVILEGDAIDEIKKIADDIEGVLHNLGREARAAEQGIKQGMKVVDGLVVDLEKYVRRELTQFLGDPVGNQVATVFDVFANTNEGVLKGAVGMTLALEDLDPRWFLTDPEGAAATWSDMLKNGWKGSFINAFINPVEFGKTNLQNLKSLLHVDDWSTARPGLGLGENAFDLATLFIPGVGEAGTAADGVGAAARGAEGAEAAGAAERAGAAEGVAGAAGARGALADIAGRGGGLTKDLEGVGGNLPKIEPPPGGQPVALPPGKPLEPPVGPAPHAPDTPPGARAGPAAAPGSTPPGQPGGPPGPAGGPLDPAGGPPASAPAGGAQEPPHEQAGAAPAPASPRGGGPNGPLLPAVGGPHEPAPLPAGAPHEPIPATESGSAPPAVPVGGPHDPASVPGGGPHEPVPVAAGSSYEPVSVPAVGSHEPVLAPAGAPLTSMPVAAGERLPSTVPQLAEHAPARVPAAPGGSPVEPAPVAAYSTQPAPSLTPSAPHSTHPGGRPTELPGSGGSHGPGDGGLPGGRSDGKPPHGGGPHGRGDGRPPDLPDDGSPGQRESPHESDGTTAETPDGGAGAGVPPNPALVPGIDYPLSPEEALRVLEHPGAELRRLADGGVPPNVLEGYEPLAGRTVEEFRQEFTVQGSSGETWWDWDTQAPKNGFAREPLESNRIPADLRLDRLGPNAGGFLSPEGVPLSERATPPGLTAQYHLFEGTGREIPPGKDWVVQHGPAKDAFGQSGGGDQWVVLDKSTGRPVPVEQLIKERLLREVTPPK